jgi:pilus assembly protein CpaB
MRLRAILMLLLALAMGATAVFLARSWLFSQMAAVRTTIQQPVRAPVDTIVVAAGPLHFGDKIEKTSIRAVEWPASALPAGAFKKVDDLIGGQPRMVLQAMEENEPVLASKITGPGARATLSAIIDEGMRALTVRVNDVLGVAGFVLPGDRVDILLTRQPEKDATPITDVLLQNVKVLGVDQVADQKADKPVVVKAATFEVTTEEAQKLVLAAQIGTLSLALRGAATVNLERVKRIGIRDLNVGQANDVPPPPPAPPKPLSFTRNDPLPVIGITRGLSRQEYKVLPNGAVVLPGAPEPYYSAAPQPGQGGAPAQPPGQAAPAQPPTADSQPGGAPPPDGQPGGSPGQTGPAPAGGPPMPLGPSTSTRGSAALTPS